MTAAARKPTLEPLVAGKTIADRYVVHSVLGQGGMGQVVLAEHMALGRRFALKVLRLEKWNDELVRRFNREARALARVASSRVAQVTDFGVDESVGPFYVMELLDGETLEDRLEERGRLPPREALTICAELCEALVDVHSNSIVHRDLKPSNVGLPASGPVGVKLLDFGLAASMDEAFLSKITQSHQILGSLPYMAPEQFNAAAAAPTMDVYAVGIVLYETLCGRLPFMAPSTAALIHQILSTPVPALPASIGDGTPLASLLERLLAKEPERRFASAKAASQALRDAARSMGGLAGVASHPRTRDMEEVPSDSVPLTATLDSDPGAIGVMPTMMAEVRPPPAESGPRLASGAVHYPAAPRVAMTEPVHQGPVAVAAAPATGILPKLFVVLAVGVVLAGLTAAAVIGGLTLLDRDVERDGDEAAVAEPSAGEPTDDQDEVEIAREAPATAEPIAAPEPAPSPLPEPVTPEPAPVAPTQVSPVSPPAPAAAPRPARPRLPRATVSPPLRPEIRPLPSSPPPNRPEGTWRGNEPSREF